jgi:hypothetical protein
VTSANWQPLNQAGRLGMVEVVATAGNLSTRKLRARRIDTNAEEEISADEFQAKAAGDYTPEWMSFLAQLSTTKPGGWPTSRFRLGDR